MKFRCNKHNLSHKSIILIFTAVTSASCIIVKKKKGISGVKQQQQVQDYLQFPFSSIGSTSSAYFTENENGQ
jgi:hypothetical protein